ncbi:hypothetical protein VTN77DRAFT_5551 [Rasamsonia byssochlamydoides]|uniref:uncharacterized protein n=1 Tax=Rasamsonia byssochlamydoides TaxID=89139 RepID=UPI003744423D
MFVPELGPVHLADPYSTLSSSAFLRIALAPSHGSKSVCFFFSLSLSFLSPHFLCIFFRSHTLDWAFFLQPEGTAHTLRQLNLHKTVHTKAISISTTGRKSSSRKERNKRREERRRRRRRRRNMAKEDNLTMTTTTPTTDPTTTTTNNINIDSNTDIPPLTTYQATTKTDLIAALRLIADSVAQQRQDASRAIISHPAILAATTAVLGIIWALLYREPSDLGLVATTMAGCVMAGLAGVGYVTSGYLELAERTGTWAWLYGKNPNPDKGRDTPGKDNGRNRKEKQEEEEEEEEEEENVILVTKYGDEIIGTVVLRVTPTATSPSESKSTPKSTTTSKSKSKSKEAATALIRAWTVNRRYRNKGIGTGLLEEAVSLCRRNAWEGPVFDEHHANSARLLPGIFLGDVFEKREVKARGVLEGVKRAASPAAS